MLLPTWEPCSAAGEDSYTLATRAAVLGRTHLPQVCRNGGRKALRNYSLKAFHLNHEGKKKGGGMLQPHFVLFFSSLNSSLSCKLKISSAQKQGRID